MKVYIIIDGGAYKGIHETMIAGVFFDWDKARADFIRRVGYAKSDIGNFYEDENFKGADEDYEDIYEIDEDWEIELDTETKFYASKIGYSSHNYIDISIEEREVI